MRLTYRGAHYQSQQPSLETTESEILGKYRGQEYPIQHPRHMAVPEGVAALKYRGQPYLSERTGMTVDTMQARSNPSVRTTSFVDRHSSACPTRQRALDAAARQHFQNIKERLDHRLQVAKAKGDHALIRMLEDEFRQISLSIS